ncbi:hypothetical protein J1N35_028116 [Gossypium stocksii]|uniref:HMA domain-containing protein n=1 Tax=Gossypium stocksii TaxID=47602 RepID=A0A9D3ZRN4_9ROSI|nr:hypothetical protein J1N35_028116 [Gossypium stocksii]
MKQKIVIKVSMHCSKCRTEALQVAAVAYGVNSVALHGPEKDKLMILGEGVDVACLTEALRKKLCHATVEIVEEVKEPSPPTPTPTPPAPPTPPPQIIYCQQPPQFECFRVVADPSPAPCTIM